MSEYCSCVFYICYSKRSQTQANLQMCYTFLFLCTSQLQEVCVCVCVRVRACVRARARACVCVCEMQTLGRIMKNKRQNFQIYYSSKCTAGQTVTPLHPTSTPQKKLAVSGHCAIIDMKIHTRSLSYDLY